MADNLYRLCDLHVHTRLSPCARGEMRLPAILDAAARGGVRYLGITDHVDARNKPAVLRSVAEELERLEKLVEVLRGCEADILAVGRHCVTEEMMSTLDFIMVSANHFHDSSVAQPEGTSLEAVGRHFVEMFRYACSLDFVDVIAHPMLVFPGTFDPTCLYRIDEKDLADAIGLARENNIAMEISPRALIHDQLEFRVRFLGMCKEAGLKFAIGSDAHTLENVGRTGMLGPLIEQLGIMDKDIWIPDALRSE